MNHEQNKFDNIVSEAKYAFHGQNFHRASLLLAEAHLIAINAHRLQEEEKN